MVQTTIRVPKRIWIKVKVDAAERELSVQETVAQALVKVYGEAA